MRDWKGLKVRSSKTITTVFMRGYKMPLMNTVVNELQKLFEDYILECEYIAVLRPETIRGYRNTFNVMMNAMPEITLEMLEPHTIRLLFKKLRERERKVGTKMMNTGIKTSTAATYRTKLNHFFKWLVAHKFLLKNPFDDMPYIRPMYADLRWLRKEEVEKIIGAVVTANYKNVFLSKRNLLIIYIFLFCGLRKGELLGLQVRDIDLDRKELTVRAETSKSKRSRIVPMNSKVLLQLKDYLQERNKRKLISPYLLVSDNLDHKFTNHGLKHLVNLLVRRSGVKFHPHRFRHTFAMNLLKQGCDIVKIQQLLGHTDLRMTAMYLRCIPVSEMRNGLERFSVDNML